MTAHTMSSLQQDNIKLTINQICCWINKQQSKNINIFY